MKTERLQVVLARHGIASRRGVISMIEEGQVSVNGAVVRRRLLAVVQTIVPHHMRYAQPIVG